jgi:small-conductance mechanosensitive channel
MNFSWYEALNGWHWVFVIAMAYMLWTAVGKYPARSTEHSRARLSVMNFMVTLSIAILVLACFIYIYDSSTQGAPKALLELSLLSWTITVLLCLWHSELNTFFKTSGSLLLVGILPAHYSSSLSVSGFMQRLDEFINLGGAEGTGLKLSSVLKWLFFFTHAFIILYYYGRMYEISHREKVRRGERKQGLQEGAINRAIVVLATSFSVIIALALAGMEIGKLSLFSGLIAAGVSIALRDLLVNMAAGMLLLWDKSIKLKDVISLDKERYGVVKNMTLRYLILEDRNEIRFLVPNSELINKTITNWTQTSRRVRVKLDFAVGYDSEVEKVKDIVAAVCLRTARVLQDPPPRILILGLGDSAINLQLRFYIDDPEHGIRNVMSDVYEQLLTRLHDAEIVIPVPRQEVRLIPQSVLDVTMRDETPHRGRLKWFAGRRAV